MRHTAEPPSWPVIHDLEVREEYPGAIEALESRVAANPEDREAVIRLGFNLWYAVVEQMRMGKPLPTKQYAKRFMDLYGCYSTNLADSADFCWAFGLGMSLFPHDFPGASAEEGDKLLGRARSLDSFWAQFSEPGAEVDMAPLRNRGIFTAYYNVA
jgi:hypothetical protein